MAPSTIYNNTFLNSLFTTKEFEFVNNMDSDMQALTSMMGKEEKNRDVLVTFINNLQDRVSNTSSGSELEEYTKLLSEVQSVFELINENIQLLQGCKQTSEEINKSIVDLLIKVDSESGSDAESKFAEEISTLKAVISDFSDVLEKTKEKVSKNDIKINQFLQNSTVEKYLDDFEINLASRPLETVHKSVDKSALSISQKYSDNNHVLLVSETKKKVFLPYSADEVLEYLDQYPDQYRSFDNVVEKEFIFPIDFFVKHPVIARFRETYALIRDRESKPILEAFKLAMDMMFRYDLNPAIIAACKTQEQLEDYLECLGKKKLDEFTDFEIRFELTPFKNHHSKDAAF